MEREATSHSALANVGLHPLPLTPSSVPVFFHILKIQSGLFAAK